MKTLKIHYDADREEAIPEYFRKVLDQSAYPEGFPCERDMEYIPESRMLVVDYVLPTPDKLPSTKEVKLLVTKNELFVHPLSQRAMTKLYEDAIYQITLRSIYELFEADEKDYLDEVVFNGWVRMIDPSTGQTTNICILSLQVSKDTFTGIDLGNADPKTCFQHLKGLSAARISKLAPVAPIAVIK